MILSQNEIGIVPSHLDYGLWFLRRLAPQHCYHITDIHVHLHLEPLRRSTLEKKKKPVSPRHVAAWQEAAQHVLAHAKPGALNLRLICDTECDSAVTSAVVQPLLASPVLLADCKLRLGARREPHLSTLALETACQVAGYHTDPALR